MVSPPRTLRPLLMSTVVAAAVAGALGYLAHVWPAPEPVPVLVARPAPPTLVPVTGRAEGQCLAFLDEFMRHPNWEITLRRAGGDQLTVDALGRARHTAGDAPARTLHLTPVELRQLHLAAEASCAPDQAGQVIEIIWGGPGSAGRTVPPSEAADQLAGFMALALAD